jgi:eukaryotic-like serine/threonine-protein kinase
VLVTLSGTAKLVDFGIAKVTGRASNLTQEGEIKGKFSYMAPEQIQSQAVDRRSDIFALGILAYLLTTGKHPFRGDNPAATVRSIISSKPPVAPCSMIPDYPAALDDVIMKALEKAPERRFASADQMLSALEAALPEALDASFSSQVAAYLQKVLGPRATERRAAIRRAQELADRQRGDGTSKSSGTLRAISLDSIPDSALPVSPERGAAASAASASNPFAPVPRSFGRGAWMLALAGACLAAYGLHLAVKDAASGDGAPSAAAALPAAPAKALELSVAPRASSALLPSALPATGHAAEQAQDETPQKETKEKHSQGRAQAKLAVAPVTAPPVAPTPAPVASPKTPASSNAWDRDTFGGRH